jgi:hypothetical protein
MDDHIFRWGDLLQIVTIVVGVIASISAMIWAGGRWTSRIESSVSSVRGAVVDSRVENKAEHAAIVQRIIDHPVHSIVAQHGERIARIETHIDKEGDK